MYMYLCMTAAAVGDREDEIMHFGVYDGDDNNNI